MDAITTGAPSRSHPTAGLFGSQWRGENRLRPIQKRRPCQYRKSAIVDIGCTESGAGSIRRTMFGRDVSNGADLQNRKSEAFRGALRLTHDELQVVVRGDMGTAVTTQGIEVISRVAHGIHSIPGS